MKTMTLSELNSLEYLLTDWIVELDSSNKPTEAYQAREVKRKIEEEIGVRERYNAKTLGE